MHFEHQDWLGTERLRTGYNSSVTPSYSVEGSFTSLPWGDGHASTGTDTDAAHFAQLDHDNESDTDHADFRQYAGKVGRFMSPDPYNGSYDPSNPQSMNRYVYAMNNPLGYVDPLGLWCVWGDGSHDNDPESGGATQSQCENQGGYWDPNDTITGCNDNSGGWPGCPG